MPSRQRVEERKTKGTQAITDIDIDEHRFDTNTGLSSSVHTVMAQRGRPCLDENLVAARPDDVAHHIETERERKTGRCENM